jgi:hypothetical protein
MASPHGGSAKKDRPIPQALLECCVCGAERPMSRNELGDAPMPLNGTWWCMHAGPKLTCSSTCRLFGGLEPGPFDDME